MSDEKCMDAFTTADVNSHIASTSPGSLVALPDLTAIGVIDVQKAVQNYSEGAARAKAALSQGFFIEAINLRVQHAELWLRLLLVHSKGVGSVISKNDIRTFGQIIKDCRPYLPDSLLNSLQSFNDTRIGAVHKYLLRGTDYSALQQACKDFQGIDKEVYDFVVKKIGRPVTSAQGRIGEVVV